MACRSRRGISGAQRRLAQRLLGSGFGFRTDWRRLEPGPRICTTSSKSIEPEKPEEEVQEKVGGEEWGFKSKDEKTMIAGAE